MRLGDQRQEPAGLSRRKSPSAHITEDCVSSRTGLGGFGEGKITSIHHDSNPEMSSLQRVAVVTSVAIHSTSFKRCVN